MGLGCEWRHAWKWWAGILGDFEKKAVSWDLTLDEASWDPTLGEASGDILTLGQAVQLGSWLKDDVGTVSIVKIVCLSLLVSKT